jgi:DNA-directed RNA polymerase II subunit RPB3
MNPSVQLKVEENGSYKFTLSGVNVSIANAIRRTILTDIKVVCIDSGESCQIEANNSRLHNEILRERLNCIPVHTKDLENLVKHYYMEVDVSNESDNIVYVTTKDFKIKKKETNAEIGESSREKIFPKNEATGFYIDFARLGSFIDESIEKERIKIKANFVLNSAKHNGSFSVVSKCTYENTRDREKIIHAWKKREKDLLKEIAGIDDLSQANPTDKKEIEERIRFEERDFMVLDAQRYFIDNSFDFTIDSIGVFTNQEIVAKACSFLQNMFFDFIKDIDTDKYAITKSCFMQEHPSTIENSFDVVIEDMDYTFGNILSYIMYQKFFIEKKILTFCGFKKFHPHDTYSILRFAFYEKVELEDVRSKLIEASNIAKDIFTKIYGFVKK